MAQKSRANLWRSARLMLFRMVEVAGVEPILPPKAKSQNIADLIEG
jgi:hypothetical protein